jgi:zinc D-Ala-D-Ala carboxypeptidase
MLRLPVLSTLQHAIIQPLTFIPPDLVTSNGATLSAKAIDAYNQLYAAAAAAGQSFYVTSSYRSYTDQVTTYNYWVGVSGQAGADTYSARPGYSEHQTGLVFDVAANGCALDCFGSTSQYQWFQQNAADFGFIQRYYAGYEALTGYKAEEWHYRYVGTAVAKDMRTKGIKTLEQYWNMPGGNY